MNRPLVEGNLNADVIVLRSSIEHGIFDKALLGLGSDKFSRNAISLISAKQREI